jgi:hypothetical protein
LSKPKPLFVSEEAIPLPKKRKVGRPPVVPGNKKRRIVKRSTKPKDGDDIVSEGGVTNGSKKGRRRSSRGS